MAINKPQSCASEHQERQRLQAKLRDALPKKLQRSDDRLRACLADLVIAVEGTDHRRDERIGDELTAAGLPLLPEVTMREYAPGFLASKAKSKRARGGLCLLIEMLRQLPREWLCERTDVAFTAAKEALLRPNTDRGDALIALLEKLQADIALAFKHFSSQMPRTDADLRRRARVTAIATALHHHGLSLGSGSNSTLVKVCATVGISKRVVGANLPDIKPRISMYEQDFFGDNEPARFPNARGDFNCTALPTRSSDRCARCFPKK